MAKLELTCSVCNKQFLKTVSDYNAGLKANPNYRPTCSKECQAQVKSIARRNQLKELTCSICHSHFSKVSRAKTSGNPGTIQFGAKLNYCSPKCKNLAAIDKSHWSGSNIPF